MPLQIAPMACSRMPKWMLRPVQSPQFTSPEPLITVWVEGITSAEPPTSSGSCAPKAFERLAARDAGRDARAGREAGQSVAPSFRQPPRDHALELGRQVRMVGPVALEAPEPGAARCGPLRDLAAPVGVDRIRDLERRVRPAKRLRGSWRRSPRRAARRAPWRCPGPASRSRCGCAPGRGWAGWSPRRRRRSPDRSRSAH